jgi:hypothetical protein
MKCRQTVSLLVSCGVACLLSKAQDSLKAAQGGAEASPVLGATNAAKMAPSEWLTQLVAEPASAEDRGLFYASRARSAGMGTKKDPEEVRRNAAEALKYPLPIEEQVQMHLAVAGALQSQWLTNAAEGTQLLAIAECYLRAVVVVLDNSGPHDRAENVTPSPLFKRRPQAVDFDLSMPEYRRYLQATNLPLAEREAILTNSTYFRQALARIEAFYADHEAEYRKASEPVQATLRKALWSRTYLRMLESNLRDLHRRFPSRTPELLQLEATMLSGHPEEMKRLHEPSER